MNGDGLLGEHIFPSIAGHFALSGLSNLKLFTGQNDKVAKIFCFRAVSNCSVVDMAQLLFHLSPVEDERDTVLAL